MWVPQRLLAAELVLPIRTAEAVTYLGWWNRICQGIILQEISHVPTSPATLVRHAYKRNIHTCTYRYIYHTMSTAQGGVGSLKLRSLQERLVVTPG